MPIVSIGLDGNLKQEEAIVGIDLGTTNSLVAWVDPGTGKPVTLKGRSGSAIVPSLIHFGPGGQIIVGRDAVPFLVDSPENTIYSVKRLMGRSYQDISSHQSSISYKIIDDDRDSLVKIRSGNRFYTPIELSSLILKELKLRAEQELGRNVSKAVITVPAYFNDVQRQATRDAGKLAGLEILRIVNEPTAASLAYGLDRGADEEKVVAVYDLGGGTFDISILRISNGIYEVLATQGDTFLGGDDFDRAIAEWWMELHNIKPEEFRDAASIRQSLRLLAEELKKDLTTREESSRQFIFEGREHLLTLSRKKLNELILPYLSKTIDCCREAMKDSGQTLRDIKEVVLVGGSTRTLAVQEAVQGFFLHSRIHTDLNPDEVVALGAALEADILAGRRTDMLLLDVTPLSLGIETLGGLMDVLIPRNTKIPARIGKQYTTSVDGQVSLKINVYQGERELVDHNRKLAEFVLKGIPAMPAGLPKIEVDFILNADGILQVDARELRSGTQQSIEVKPQYGLTDEQVEQLLLDSITHAGEDVAERMLREAKTEAQQMLYVTERFLGKNASLLTDEELQHSNLLLNDLRNALESNDKDTILGHIDELNEYTRPFAERLMDQSISSALKGKNIEG